MKWLVKQKSRTVGAVYELSNGDLAYLARRWRGEIFCGGEKSISTAVSMGKEEWAFDFSELLDLRLKGVKYVGVIERNRGGMLYLTTLEKCLDPQVYKFRDLNNRSSAAQHFIGHKHFMIKACATKF